MALVIMLSVFAPLSTDVFLSSLPEMVVYFNTNESVMNITLYGFFLSMGISFIFLGPISDKYGRKPVLLATMALYCTSSVLCALSNDIVSLIVFRVLQAIGGGGALVISVALIKDCFEVHQIDRVLAIVTVVSTLGPVFAPIIGAVITHFYDWRMTFIFPAVFAFVCFMMALLMDETLKENERLTCPVLESISRLREPLRDTNFLLFMIMTSIFSIPFMGYIGSSSYIYQNIFGVSELNYGGFMASTIILGVVIMMVLRKVLGKVGERYTLPTIVVLGMSSFVLMVTVGHVSEYMFLISMLPLATLMPFGRTFGFRILITQREGDNGVVSSLLNLSMSVFGVIGMIVCSLPFEDHIMPICVALFVCSVIYFVLWSAMRISDSKLKGLEDI